VKLAYCSSAKTYLACKVIERQVLKARDLINRFEAEIRVHQQMRHPGIVTLLDVLQDDDFYYVFLEFCAGGELFDFILSFGRLSESHARPIVIRLLEAMEYMHAAGVSHRDLKPENLLLDQYGHPKISDFGMAKFIGPDGLVSTPCGSPCYASPECLSGKPYNGRTSDCWSFGVITYAMLTGELPWTRKNQRQLFDQIRRGDYTVPPELSDVCRDFVTRLMCVDHTKRMTAAEAREHPFLRGPRLSESIAFQSPRPLISLKRIDAYFGDSQSTVDVPREREMSSPSKGFQSVCRQISPARPRKSFNRPKAVNRSSGRFPSPVKRPHR
jgi:serine/threonine protein kinase